MPRDIRSYFAVNSKKPTATTVVEKDGPVIKRKAVVVSSDDEVEESPGVVSKKSIKKTTQNVSKKRRIVDSDDENDKKETQKLKKLNLSKLKTNLESEKKVQKIVDVANLFSKSPVKRVEKKRPVASITTKEIDIYSDEELEKTLLLLDESATESNSLSQNGKRKLDKIIDKTSPKKEAKSPKKEISNKSKSNSPEKIVQQTTPVKEKTIKKEESDKTNTSASITKEKKKLNKSSHDIDSITDEERHERKRLSAVLYQKFKNRSGPLNPGSKKIPEGTQNCLAGLSFIVTGVLESLERDEANDLIKHCGGKICSTVTKKLDYMVLGEDAGPAKLAKADEFGIKKITEDELLNLIRERSKLRSENNSKTEEKKHHKKIEKDVHVKVKKLLSPKKEIKREEKTPDKRKLKDEHEPRTIKRENLDNECEEIKLDKDEALAWVDKYKPSNLKEIIGQQGAASNSVKLLNWLSKWHYNQDGKKKLQKPNPWAKSNDGSYFKAALLSGPPGVGKTTTATLVCKELGFDTVEFNASDTRSKKLLKEQVSELLSNKSLYGYFHGKKEKGVSKHHVLLMDEVDGMAGNEDRGGIQELISLIKESSVPIICMCNDRNHQKMRSLVNYCFDLRFNKPRLEQIKGPMMSICFKEKMKLPPGQLEEIISATNNDIRQTLNFLSLMGVDKKDMVVSGDDKKQETAKKDLKLGPWDVVHKVFSFEEHKKMSIHDKSDLFFNDYSLGPLFVQENYLSVNPNVPKSEVMNHVAMAADSLSRGDLIDNRIRSNNAWSLLPVQAMFSSVMPGEFMAGNFTKMVNFPGWLGKNSKKNKRNRMAQEIHDHTRIATSGSRLSIRLDYVQFLLAAITKPLLDRGNDGVEESLSVIKEYRLLREDIESLIELTAWPGKKNPMDSIDGKVKGALTRAYNKEISPYTYSATAAIKKKKAISAEEDNLYGEEGGEDGTTVIADDSSDEDPDTLDNDALIKAKKKPATSKASVSSSTAGSSQKTSKAGPSTSRGKNAPKNKK